jgi:hypothetical protein
MKFCTSKFKHFEFIEHNFFCQMALKMSLLFYNFFFNFMILKFLYDLMFYQVHQLMKILLFAICHHMIVCN